MNYEWLKTQSLEQLKKTFNMFHNKGSRSWSAGDLKAEIINLYQNKTGRKNKEVAKDLGCSISMITMSKYYLENASSKLRKWMVVHQIGLSTGYIFSRIENVDNLDYIPASYVNKFKSDKWMKPDFIEKILETLTIPVYYPAHIVEGELWQMIKGFRQYGGQTE